MTIAPPPQALDAEVGLLGALLIAPSALTGLTVDSGIRSEHFYDSRHRKVFDAMLSLAERGEPVDIATVGHEAATKGVEAGFCEQLAVHAGVFSHTAHYAKGIRDAARLRDVQLWARELGEAAQRGDEERIADITGRLLEPEQAERRVTVESRQHALVEHFEHETRTWPWPFPMMNELTFGGMWPGHLTLLVGISGHGKSVMADGVLETAAKHGAKCCAYLTEMTPLERDLRFIARRADIPMKRLMGGKLQDGEHRRFTKTIAELPFEIVPCGTWTVAEVGRDIRRRRPDIAVIDLLNALPGREVKDIDENVGHLAGIANDTGCHIVACNHLNRARLTGQSYPPEPAQGDIRGSGSLYDLSTNVLSVYRRERTLDGEGTGEPGDDSVLRFLKVKNGITGGKLDVVFRGSRMRFELPLEPGTVAAVAM